MGGGGQKHWVGVRGKSDKGLLGPILTGGADTSTGARRGPVEGSEVLEGQHGQLGPNRHVHGQIDYLKGPFANKIKLTEKSTVHVLRENATVTAYRYLEEM